MKYLWTSVNPRVKGGGTGLEAALCSVNTVREVESAGLSGHHQLGIPHTPRQKQEPEAVVIIRLGNDVQRLESNLKIKVLSSSSRKEFCQSFTQLTLYIIILHVLSFSAGERDT